jgi:hypothetical protein
MELITKKLEDFKIDIPISWEDITNQISIWDNLSKVELFVFENNKNNHLFLNNLSVVSTTLEKNINLIDFLIDYEKISEEYFTLDNWKKIKIIFLKLKDNRESDIMYVLYTVNNCDKKDFIISINLLEDTSDIIKYKEVLKSFECVK